MLNTVFVNPYTADAITLQGAVSIPPGFDGVNKQGIRFLQIAHRLL